MNSCHAYAWDNLTKFICSQFSDSPMKYNVKKLKLIRQHDSMQCGGACLAMVSSYYGKSVSLESVSELCHSTAEGVSLMSMVKGANLLGLNAVAVKATLSQLLDIKRPCVVHWNQNHFVVVIEETGKGNSL